MEDRTRRRVVSAVQLAVCDVTGTDGYGHCQQYAHATAAVLMRATGRPYAFQAGSLYVAGDPADPTLEACLLCEQAGLDGEAHCWVIGPLTRHGPTGYHAITQGMNLIDTSSRHFRQFVQTLGLQWTRPEPPSYIWATQDNLPDWVHYAVDGRATRLLGRDPAATEVARVAVAYYLKATAPSVTFEGLVTPAARAAERRRQRRRRG